MADIKISELAETTDLEGLYTVGTDKNNLSKKVALQFVKDAANYANEQGDYAKEVGDTVNGNVGVDDYPAFSASTSYSAGDIVRFNGVLYQFTANHAASAWNGNDVKATSINAITSGKLTELEGDFYGKEGSTRSIASELVTNSGYVEKNGKITADNTWVYCNPYMLHKGETLSVDMGDLNGYPSIAITQASIVNIGDTIQLISPIDATEYTATEDVYVVISGTLLYGNIRKAEVTTPREIGFKDNVYIKEEVYSKTESDERYMQKSGGGSDFVTKEELPFVKLTSDFPTLFFEGVATWNNQSANVIATAVDGGVRFKSDTQANVQAAFKLSLQSGKRYIVEIVDNNGAFFNTQCQLFTGTSSDSLGMPYITPEYADNHYTFEFYKDDRDIFIFLPLSWKAYNGVTIDVAVKEYGEPTKEYISSDDVIKKIDEGSFSNEILKRCPSLIDNPTLYRGMDIVAFNKCICIGDSLTRGSINTTDEQGTTGDNAPYDENVAYPAKLARLTGMQVTNAGQGGTTFKSYYIAHASDDWRGYEMAIVKLGVNDADITLGGGGWTDDSAYGLTSIIEKLKNENKGIKIFVSTIEPGMSYQDWGNSVMAQRLKSVNDGIRNYVANLNDVDVILLDMEKYSTLYESNGYSCGHLSQYGYYRIAQDFCNYISCYMNTHKQEFRFIQFIGTDYTYTKDY